jgi:hypothetical protein
VVGLVLFLALPIIVASGAFWAKTITPTTRAIGALRRPHP